MAQQPSHMAQPSSLELIRNEPDKSVDPHNFVLVLIVVLIVLVLIFLVLIVLIVVVLIVLIVVAVVDVVVANSVPMRADPNLIKSFYHKDKYTSFFYKQLHFSLQPRVA